MLKCIILLGKDALHWSKVTVKTFIILQKILFFWTFYSSKNPERKLYYGFHKILSSKKQFSMLIIIWTIINTVSENQISILECFLMDHALKNVIILNLVYL